MSLVADDDREAQNVEAARRRVDGRLGVAFGIPLGAWGAAVGATWWMIGLAALGFFIIGAVEYCVTIARGAGSGG